MRNLVSDFGTYLRAVFVESQTVVLTAFDILGITLFLFPHLAESLVRDELRIRIIGAAVFFLSFLVANFRLYKRMASDTPKLDENSLLIYPYENPPYNDVEMRFIGDEPVKDLDVRIISKNKDGEEKQTKVEHFSKENDTRMLWTRFKANVLTKNEVVRFHLLRRKEQVMDGKVTVVASFVGARTGKAIQVSKDIELEL